jgi:hypothetical protein
MFDDVLYIIGNGFDLHHGVKSSYGAFHDWLAVHDREICSIYEEVCDYEALWSDFESGMAYVSRDYFLETGIAFLPNPKSDSDDWTMAEMILGGDYASCAVSHLLDHLKRDFHRWVSSIATPRDYKDKILYVDDRARFLTFNYTLFLESQYGIESNHIKHIHGVKSQQWGSIVVGHGEDNDKIFDDWWRRKGYEKLHYTKKGKEYYKRDTIYKMYRGNTKSLPEYKIITDAVESYYTDAQKPVDRIIKKHSTYFDDLFDIRTVYTWGISFSMVDRPYMKKIIEVNIDRENMQWYVSAYSDADHDRALDCLLPLGIPRENIHFKPMADFLKR